MGKAIKVGDKVNDECFGNGEVIQIGKQPWPYAVAFDKKTDGLHDCKGLTEIGRGAYYSEDEIIEMMPSKAK